jgi:hypothetical protein
LDAHAAPRVGYFLTFSVPLTGIPQTVPVYATAMVVPSLPNVAVLLAKANGQFTPPWETRPLALQLMAEPASVPDPDPVTVMLLAQVAVKDTLAALVVVGVTVYLRLPHPVGGVLAVTDCQVPANASIEADGVVGLVGVLVELLSCFEKRLQPAVASEAARRATTTPCERAARGSAERHPRGAAPRRRLLLDFMIFLIVTYDFLL